MRTDFYRAFEDAYRGSRELITQRLQVYLPFLQKLGELREAPLKLLDMGCGRGEWLELTQQHGCEVFGIDLDEGMLAACHELGLPVQQGDALQYLRELPDASLDVLSAFHVVEHLDFAVLEDLLTHARRVLRPAGLLILETPNPENVVVGSCNFYLDPTHIKPIPPALLDFLVKYHGFERNKILRLQENPVLRTKPDLALQHVLSGPSPDYAVLGQQAADPELMAAFEELFAVNHGLRMAELAGRYDKARAQEIQQLRQQAQKLEKNMQEAQETAHTQWQELTDAMKQQMALVSSLSQQLIQAQAELEQCRSTLTIEQTQHRVAQAAQQKSQLQVHRLTAANRDLQVQCQAYRNSWSWKLTAPLRLGLDATHAITRPQTWFASTLRHAANVINRSPRLNRSVRGVLRHTPGLERWLIEKAYCPPELASATVAAAPAQANSFEQFLQRHIRWDSPADPAAQPGPIALMQNAASPQSVMLGAVLGRSIPGLNAALILQLQSGARPHFTQAPTAERDEMHLALMVEHIYLALLRRYPSALDREDKVRLLLKTRDVNHLITSIKKSPEYLDRYAA